MHIRNSKLEISIWLKFWKQSTVWAGPCIFFFVEGFFCPWVWSWTQQTVGNTAIDDQTATNFTESKKASNYTRLPKVEYLKEKLWYWCHFRLKLIRLQSTTKKVHAHA